MALHFKPCEFEVFVAFASPCGRWFCAECARERGEQKLELRWQEISAAYPHFSWECYSIEKCDDCGKHPREWKRGKMKGTATIETVPGCGIF